MIIVTDLDGRPLGIMNTSYPAPPEELERQAAANPNTRVVDHPPISQEFWYYPEGVPTIRPRLSLTMSEVGTLIRVEGIPTGAQVTVTYQREADSRTHTGGALDMDFDGDGEANIVVEHWPHQTERLFVRITND